MDNNEIPKVIVLTAIMISYKGWNNVTARTIHKCFRTCGFVKVIDKQEDESPVTVEVDNQWHRLLTVPVKQLSTFKEFLAIDDHLIVCGSLSDNEILNKVEDKKDNDEEGKSSEESPVTLKEAKSGLRAVVSFLQSYDGDDRVFSSIRNLDNSIERASASDYIHIQITDFFLKNIIFYT